MTTGKDACVTDRQGCLCHGPARMPVSRTGKDACVTDWQGCLCPRTGKDACVHGLGIGGKSCSPPATGLSQFLTDLRPATMSVDQDSGPEGIER